MKKLLVLLLTVFALNSCEKDPEIIGIDAEKKMLKVEVCHYDADTDTWKTLSISENALKAHLKHGDYEGSCCDRTYVPDDQFETALIYYGYDDVMDDYVKTCNIQDVTRFTFEYFVGGAGEPYGGVKDFTGIEGFKSLTQLEIKNLHGPKIDLSKNIALEHLGLTGNWIIRELDLSKNKNLKSFGVQLGTMLNSLILPQDDDNQLERLFLNKGLGVRISSLDLSKNNKLIQMTCGLLDLNDIKFPNGENNLLSTISGFMMFDSDGKHLNLSNSKNLTGIDIGGNFETVNINNGNNEALNYFIIANATSLTCVQVDDVDYAKGADNWHVPSPDVYSTDCGN